MTSKALQIIAQHCNNYLYELRMRGCAQAAQMIQDELNKAIQEVARECNAGHQETSEGGSE